MSPEIIGFIGIIFLIVLMFSRVWVGTSMIIVGFVGYGVLAGWDKALLMIGMEPFAQTAYYPLTAIPLFVLMGTLSAVTGISSDLYNAVVKWIGHIRGGLAMATVGACGLFAAVCGDGLATAVTMGKIAFPEMKNRNYADTLSAASIIAGGTIGLIIPPSLGFILYGLLTRQSVGALFVAGIIPGITQVFFYMAAIFLLLRKKPGLGPSGLQYTNKEKLLSLATVWPMLLLFLLIIVGIYRGVFTPTEAGAVGTIGAVLIGLFLRRLNWLKVRSALVETTLNTALVLFIIIGAYVFMNFIAVSHLPVALSEYIIGLAVPSILIIIGILVLYIVLGSLMDILVAVILTVPIFFPIIIGLGYDPIWWGVLTVKIIATSMITPPVGINLFVISKTVQVPLSTVYRGILPFVWADFAHIALLVAVPELSLLLVRMM